MRRLAVLALLASCAPTVTDLRVCGAGTVEREGQCVIAPRELPRLSVVEQAAFPLPAHLESKDLPGASFASVFEAGRRLFHTELNGLDGVGMRKLPNGTPLPRFRRSPPGGGHPSSVSAEACGSCHNAPFSAAAGREVTTVIADGLGKGPPYAERNTTSLFGNGAVQRVAEELTEELQAIRDELVKAAQSAPGTPVSRPLVAKGISYGSLSATASPTVVFDLAELEGVDPDLVVRPMGAKGNLTLIRSVAVIAANFNQGLQPEEYLWKAADGGADPDPDGDGVTRELSAGDITAITVYNAAQETPASLEQLARLGFVAAASPEELALVARGQTLFAEARCDGCHRPEVHLKDTWFEEPTLRGNGHYFDAQLASKDPGYDPRRPVRFDLLADADEPRAEADPRGGARLRVYGDFKRHNMGRQLADPGPTKSFQANLAPLMRDGQLQLVAPSVFLTPELWGVADTSPWLHDGRAATLREAILLHGEDQPAAIGSPDRSEAQESRDAFAALAEPEQKALVAFLGSLRLWAKSRRP